MMNPERNIHFMMVTVPYFWVKGLIKKPSFIAEQGLSLGRPGQATVTVLGPPQAISGVRIAGQAHVTMSGKLNL
jgi:predicted PhzF superfamily epimerase YddE/YHI9